MRRASTRSTRLIILASLASADVHTERSSSGFSHSSQVVRELQGKFFISVLRLEGQASVRGRAIHDVAFWQTMLASPVFSCEGLASVIARCPVASAHGENVRRVWTLESMA